MDQSSLIMTPSDVCTLLRIKESTLRKYALILHNAGYHFDTNDKGQRAYYDKDVTVLRRFLEVKNSPDMTLEQSANAVMVWVKGSNVSLPDMRKDDESDRYNTDIKELKERVLQQNILLQELMKKMDAQQRYIDERLEDRDRKLMNSIRDSQEVKQQLLQLAVAQEQKKTRRGLLKWFGKE